MKKILVISYHSLPFDVIASYRANAYLKHFKKFGLDPTLLTHYVGMSEKNEVTTEMYEYGSVIRIPIKKSILGIVTDLMERISAINKFSIFSRWLCGFLDTRPEDIDSYFSLKSYCFKRLDIYQFDVVLGIFSPHHHLRLCYQLNKKFKIPYILDFRDLWDNRVMHCHYSPNLTERIQDSLVIFYWRKWLVKALFFSITSNPWKEKINQFSNTKGYIIHNGYDSEDFEQQVHKKKNDFIILHAGSLYEHQKLDLFFEGCNRFIKRIKPINFKIKFIGADRSFGSKKINSFMRNPSDTIRNQIQDEYVEILPRIPKSEILQEMRSSDLLLFPSFPDAPGTYAGKIYDYLGARKNILMVPDDNSVVGELVRSTQAGFICNTAAEIEKILIQNYRNWQENNELEYNGIIDEIERYSRKSQVRKISNYINEQ